MSYKVPPRVEEKGGGFLGRPMRDVWIAGLGIALALMAALWIPGPIWLKVAVGVLIAGLGLAIGLGRDQGRWRLEERIYHVIAHRRRQHRRVWRKPAAGEPEVVTAAPVAPPAPEPVPVPIPADEREGFGMVQSVELWWGLVTVFVMTLLSGVLTYLASGGSQDLFLWIEFMAR